MYKNQTQQAIKTGVLFCLLAALLLAGCKKNAGDLISTADTDALRTEGKPGNPLVPGINKPLGTWWWSVNKKDWDTYLNFAQQNGVTEIYFSTVDFSETTGGFIEKAAGKGIRVFLLAGSYVWISDRTGFINLMNKYTQYQNTAVGTKRFAGIHLDVEPHQDPTFAQRRAVIMQQYIDFVTWVTSQYSAAGNIDFDIPFWLDDTVLYKGQNRLLYEAVISEATRVFIMSYRDTAAKMYDVSKEEIAFASSLNKQLFLGAETAPSSEGDAVSYAEEGKAYMYSEFKKLSILCGNADYGVSVHHISTWYKLKN
ncbi:hypothetical protein LQ567_11635 [Niabella pedocola]|uniref:Uncharacterized protein n=1 Tax=Niabella pedocola TaxID=1752077 RepID=A0ABS8PQP0_9BACT|nr:hypothetical protein [Niabella pedocola]MCD2423416.1 hypothetical protein [Niabella pedocola]